MHVLDARLARLALGSLLAACALPGCAEHRTLDPRPGAESDVAEAAPNARGYEVPVVRGSSAPKPPPRLQPDLVMPDDPFGAPPMASGPVAPSARPAAPAPGAPTGKAL